MPRPAQVTISPRMTTIMNSRTVKGGLDRRCDNRVINYRIPSDSLVMLACAFAGTLSRLRQPRMISKKPLPIVRNAHQYTRDGDKSLPADSTPPCYLCRSQRKPVYQLS